MKNMMKVPLTFFESQGNHRVQPGDGNKPGAISIGAIVPEKKYG
jgi:hypothetical protein